MSEWRELAAKGAQVGERNVRTAQLAGPQLAAAERDRAEEAQARALDLLAQAQQALVERGGHLSLARWFTGPEDRWRPTRDVPTAIRKPNDSLAGAGELLAAVVEALTGQPVTKSAEASGAPGIAA